MSHRFPILQAAILTTALLAGPAFAATIIVDEDWQSPVDSSNNLRLSGTENPNNFAGWDFSGGSNVFMQRHHGDQFMPQAGLSPNIGIQFEWANTFATYDTTHSWASDDVYSISLNATEMNWGNSNDRIVAVRLRETVSNTLVWSGQALLPEYDAAHAGAGDDWAANQFFTWDFSAADFTGGTEGSALTFEVGSLDPGAGVDRGLSVDNIQFSLVPEPSSLAMVALSALAGLTLIRRRCH